MNDEGHRWKGNEEVGEGKMKNRASDDGGIERGKCEAYGGDG